MNSNNFVKYLKKITNQHISIDLSKIKGLSSNSTKIKKNYIFVAVKGPVHDGHKFIEESIKSGAVYVLCDNDYNNNVPHIAGKLIKLRPEYDTSKIYFELLNQYNNSILNNFTFTGITGTNGKTTTSYLINSIFKAAFKKSFIIGTTGCIFDRKKNELNNTTPGADELFKIFKYAEKNNYDNAVMEISSHALDQNRVPPEIFKGTVFTNLTLDHLDYHAGINNYFNAKLKLFTAEKKNKTAAINIDDKYGKKIYNICRYTKKVSYSIKNNNADFYCSDIKYSYQHTEFKIIHLKSNQTINIKSNLIGEHNVYNILSAVALAFSFKIPVERIKKGINNMKIVPGRLEKILLNGRLFMVDYAHTPDALINVLKILNILKQNRIITVFGCGGDRDKSKRPKMFNAAVTKSDFVFVTSDNPRTEKPMDIINDIIREEGKKYKSKYSVVADRRRALAEAFRLSEKNDIILVAGKGHENYQIIGKKINHFSDVEEVKKLK